MTKKSPKTINYIKHLNLSRNSIEDKGASLLANIFKEFSQTTFSQFNYLSLSKCSINSKGANSVANSLKDYLNTLNVLDLSSNNLKDDTKKFFRSLVYIILNLILNFRIYLNYSVKKIQLQSLIYPTVILIWIR